MVGTELKVSVLEAEELEPCEAVDVVDLEEVALEVKTLLLEADELELCKVFDFDDPEVVAVGVEDCSLLIVVELDTLLEAGEVELREAVDAVDSEVIAVEVLLLLGSDEVKLLEELDLPVVDSAEETPVLELDFVDN